jgi:hypothetical protein
VKAKEHDGKRQQMRETIAHLAAKLMAEDGIRDYAAAKRKAARQIGAHDTHSLPSNDEIEQALRTYQEIYQKDEHRQRLRTLRQLALSVMKLFTDFDPHLVGPVLTGTAARHADINLQLFTDNAKEVEHFLLNAKIPYKRAERAFRVGDVSRSAPVFALYNEEAAIEVMVLTPGDLRNAPRVSGENKAMERARAEQVETLLEDS